MKIFIAPKHIDSHFVYKILTYLVKRIGLNNFKFSVNQVIKYYENDAD